MSQEMGEEDPRGVAEGFERLGREHAGEQMLEGNNGKRMAKTVRERSELKALWSAKRD